MKKLLLLLFSLCLCASVVEAQQTTIRTPITNPQFDNQPGHAQIAILPAPNQVPHEEDWFNELGIVGCYVGTNGLLSCNQSCSSAFTSGCGGGGTPAPPVDSIQYNSPLGSFDGSSTFTSTPYSGNAPNELLNILLNSGTNFEVDAPISPSTNNCFIDGVANVCQTDGSNGAPNLFTFLATDSGTQASTAYPLTNIAVASQVVTAITSTDASALTVGMTVTFSGLTGDTFLNGQFGSILNSSATGFTAIADTSDYSSAPETGQASAIYGTSPDSILAGLNLYIPGDSGNGLQVILFGQNNPLSETGVDILFSDPEVTNAIGLHVESINYGTQSAQVLLEPMGSSQGDSSNAHQYDILQINNQNFSPGFWTYSDGSANSIAGFYTDQSAAVSCTETDSNTCTASITSGVGGPPMSETIRGQFCAAGSTYDTFDWTHDPTAVLCSGGNHFRAVEASSPGNFLEDGINVLFSSVTGHAVGTTFSIPVTVTPGPQVTSFGLGTVGYTAAQISALTPFPFEEVWVTDAASTASCLVGSGSPPLTFKCVYENGAWTPQVGGGGGACAGSANQLLFTPDGLACDGIPGSVVDGTNGLVSLLSLTSVGTTLSVTAGPGKDAVDVFSLGNEENATLYVISDPPEQNPSQAGEFEGSSIDNVGAGVPAIALGASAQLTGINATGDNELAIEASITNSWTGGNPVETTAIMIALQANPDGFPALISTGLHISDENANGHPASSTNAAILLDSQTPGPNVYSIKTEAGPVDFGDIISPGILTLADGLAEITTFYIGPAIFTGTGTNDLTSGGTYTGTQNLIYCVQIDATGTPDTFEWGTYAPGSLPNCSNGATGVPITGAAQTLSNNVTVTFGSTTTHTVSDQWTIAATAALGDGFEFNCADCDTPTAEGAVCTNTIDNAGARVVYIRGAAHCF